jgi:type IV pilus assembly protein PilO
MAYSEEFQTDLAGDGAEPKGFFDAFGVEFTSTILGVMLAIAGIAGAGAIWWFLVKPVTTETETLQAELQQKEAELQQKQAAGSANQIAELEAQLVQEERIASEVINAYGKDKQIQTFLLDLNRILTASDIQLVSYEPTSPQPEFITDDVYGEAAINKLKRQTFNVSFENMTYAQVDSMLENLDLLQPLVVLREFSTDIAEPPSYLYTERELIPQTPTKLGISFVIDALIAPTPEELAARQEELAAEAAPPEEAPPQ